MYKVTTDQNDQKQEARGTAQINPSDSKNGISFKQNWDMIKSHVEKIIESIKNRKSMEDEYIKIYSIVYNLALKKVYDLPDNSMGPTECVYNSYKMIMRDFVQRELRIQLEQTDKEAEQILAGIHNFKQNYQMFVKVMVRSFSYLDRYFTTHSFRASTSEIADNVFKEAMSSVALPFISPVVLKAIKKERSGHQIINGNTVKSSIDLIVQESSTNQNAYKFLENGYLRCLEEHVAFEMSALLAEEESDTDLLAYSRRMAHILDRENALCASYMLYHTQPLVQEAIDRLMRPCLDSRQPAIAIFLKNCSADESRETLELLSRLRYISPFEQIIRDRVKEEGSSVLERFKHDETLLVNSKPFISALLDQFNNNISRIPKEPQLLRALTGAFKDVVNMKCLVDKTGQQITMSELVQHCLGQIMSSSSPSCSIDTLDSNDEEILDNIVTLITFLDDKDMFLEYYRVQLSKRLLAQINPHIELERQFLSKLRLACGASYTRKLEGMIRDKYLSEELRNEYVNFSHEHQQDDHATTDPEQEPNAIMFQPTILTLSYWPVLKMVDVTLPEEMLSCLVKFKEFYGQKCQSRTLQWVHSLGNCLVHARFRNGDKDIFVSTYQAIILLMFNRKNDDESITVRDMVESTKLPFEDVKRNVLALSTSKRCSILRKAHDNMNQKQVCLEDSYCVNAAFESKTRSVRPPNVVFVITETERSNIAKTTEEGRKQMMEAAIVRIMKSRRKMDHHSLIAETTRQLMPLFEADVALVRRCIDNLIEREYIARDNDDSKSYVYLA